MKLLYRKKKSGYNLLVLDKLRFYYIHISRSAQRNKTQKNLLIFLSSTSEQSIL